MTGGNHNQDLFIEAREQFLASLSPVERSLFSKCKNATDLLADLGKFDAHINKQQWLLPHITKIETLTQRLSPFFEAIGIIVQSHPEVAAIAWGALRLVLQVIELLVFRS